jgi:hypothetical protein
MGMQIAPGMNEIKDEKILEKLKEHPTFQELLKVGKFKIIRKENEVDAVAEEIANEIDPDKKEELKKELKPKPIVGSLNIKEVTKNAEASKKEGK